MGGFQSIEIGLAHPELFGYVLAYSGGFGSLGPQPPAAPIETQAPWRGTAGERVGNEEAPAAAVSRLRPAGDRHARAGTAARAAAAGARESTRAGRTIRAGHVFSVWRNLLHESVPMLFRQPSDGVAMIETETRGGRRAGVRAAARTGGAARAGRIVAAVERALGDDVGDGAAAGADASAVRTAASWCSRRRPPACRPR